MRRAPLLALFLLGLSLVVPARASGDGFLLRGSRTAYVDLYVYENTTIDPDMLRLSGHGSYVGFFMSPAPANRDTVGALVMPRVGATGGTEVMKLGASWDVRAGKYRVYLLTDGAAEVFVPIAGQGYRGWVPTHRAPFSVRRADFSVPAGSFTGSRHLALSLKSRSLVIAAGIASSTSLTAIDQLDVCVSQTDACAVSYSLAARPPAARTWTYGVQLAMPGRYQGVLDMTRVGGVDAGSKVAGAVLVLTLGRQT